MNEKTKAVNEPIPPGVYEVRVVAANNWRITYEILTGPCKGQQIIGFNKVRRLRVASMEMPGEAAVRNICAEDPE